MYYIRVYLRCIEIWVFVYIVACVFIPTSTAYTISTVCFLISLFCSFVPKTCQSASEQLFLSVRLFLFVFFFFTRKNAEEKNFESCILSGHYHYIFGVQDVEGRLNARDVLW